MPDKTEAPTARRLEEAREEGQVVRSQELNSAAILLAAAYLISGPGRQLGQVFRDLFTSAIAEVSHVEITTKWLQQTSLTIAWRVLPPLGMILVGLLLVGVAVTMGQTRFLWSSKRVGFDFSRLNPLNGFKRIFSSRGLVELLKASLKLILVGWVAYSFLNANYTRIIALSQLDLNQGAGAAFDLAFSLALRVGSSYLVLAVADYAYQRWDLMRSLRMSKEEIKEEFRRSEGDPILKGRIRAQMRRMARGRMMANVPKATVIVTNPTHLAIALHYEEGMTAPKVLAKGAHKTAERIVALAREHQIPVVQNIPLARAIFKRVEVDQEIAPDLYLAMAEVLAYVYRLKGRVPHAQTSSPVYPGSPAVGPAAAGEASSGIPLN
jgi:flagellar biosynthetic protein FlhB